MSFLSSLFSVKAQNSENIKILNTTDFKEAISVGKVQLVDVRTANEYKAGHIENAINIDFFQRSVFHERCNKLDRDQPVYLYCRSGARSRKAAGKLIEMGFTMVYDLKGGYMAWR